MGPSLAPRRSALTPVRASPPRGDSPISRSVSSTSRAVLTSLNPSSGLRRMLSPTPMICSARRSMASHTLCLTSSRVGIGGSSRGYALAEMKRSGRNGKSKAGTRPVSTHSLTSAAVIGASRMPFRK